MTLIPLLLALSTALGLSGLALAAEGSGVPTASSPERPSPAVPTYSSMRYDIDYPTVHYTGLARENPIARLEGRIDRGEITLEFQGPRGYLDSLLKALDIDPSSQVLVFSKTSLQIEHISARTPRAIYFNDDTYVAWVQGSDLIELSAMDSSLGAVFYTLLNRKDASAPFERRASECLACHDTFSMAGGGVPRFLLSSTPVDTDGIVVPDGAPQDTDDRTPLAERWAGWYVTGSAHNQDHLGNLLIPHGGLLADFRSQRPGTLASVARVLDSTPYLTDKSDIVALLVLEHQIYVKNQITRLSYKSRTFLARDVGPATPDFATFENASPRTRSQVRAMVEQLVRALLFADAASYRGSLASTSGFDRWFTAQGPRDSHGRSLRDFDLHTRLFRYPLSYVIYSDAFNALPAYVKALVYARLGAILSGADRTPQFGYLSDADRRSMLEILTATKPEFALETHAVQAASLQRPPDTDR